MSPRGRRSGFAKKIDTVHWAYGSFTFSAQAAGTAAVQMFPAQHLPETLMRTRGEWVGWLEGARAPGDAVAVGVGLIQVPEGTGTTVLWSPITDGDAPWIWLDYAILAYEETVVDVIDIPQITAVRRLIDSKAMRKIRNTELQVVVENASIFGTASVNVLGQGRILSGS